MTVDSTVSWPAGPATLDAVRRHLRVTTTADDDLIQDAVDAANAWISTLPGPQQINEDWFPNLVQGGVMLAARLFRRRNSPAGVEAFSDLGGAVYVQRNDPDIAMMLGLGPYARPRTG